MNKLFTKIAALALGATMAVGVGVAVASNSKEASPVHAASATWNKITSTPVSGTKYLILSSDAKQLFDSSTSTIDSTSNHVALTGTSSSTTSITGDYDSKAWDFTLSGSTWYISRTLSSTTTYIGRSTNSNGITTATSTGSTVANTITNNSGAYTIKGSASRYLSYNTSSGRFRYFASGTVMLFEKAASPQTISGATSAYIDETVTLSSNASSTVTWSIVTADTDAAGAAVTSGGVVSVTGAGTVKVKAVASGYADATHTITFSVRPTGTYYDVTFDSNGGSSSPAKQSIKENATFTFPSPGTKTHYSFDGWSSDGGSTLYDEGDTSPAVVDDIEYTAYWTQDAQTTVIYKSGDGSGSDISSTEYAGSYSLASFPGTWTAPSGKAFSKWSDGSSQYSAGANYTLVGNTTVTFTAVYKAVDEYTLFSGDIVEGDYVIYSDGVALKNSIASNRAEYTSVSPSNNKIIDPDNSIVWSIQKSGEESWLVVSKDDGKYLAGNGTKNQIGLFDDTSADRTWSITGPTDGAYSLVSNRNNSASVNDTLRRNGTYGFACYGSGTGTGISLYKAPSNELDHVTTSGQTTSFTAGNTFSYGGTLTAYYTIDDPATKTPTSFKLDSESGATITTSTVLTKAAHDGHEIYVLYTEDKITKSAHYTISVSYAAVTSVVIDQHAAEIGLEELYDGYKTVGVTVNSQYADQGYEWIVSANTVDDEYLFDSSGLLSGNTEGTITLRCRSTADNSKYDELVVTVTGDPTADFTPASVSGYVGKSDDVAFTYGNMSDTSLISITSSNSSIAEVDEFVADEGEGLVTVNFVAAGSATLSISYNGGSALDTLEVTVSADSVTALSWSAPTIKVYSGATTTVSDASSWNVHYTMASGDEGDLSYGEYTLKLGGSSITLPHTWDASEDGKVLGIEYGGFASPITSTVDITQSLQAVNKPNEGDSYYQLVSTDADLEAGRYLIVSQDDNLAFNGSLATIDAGQNHFSVTINNGVIADDSASSGKYFDLTVSGTAWTITSASGSNVAHSSSKNGMDGNGTNSISISDGVATIAGSGGKELQYNATSGSSNERFRYYTSGGQHSVSLFKLVTEEGEGSTNIANVAGHEAAQKAVVAFAKAMNAAFDDTANCTDGVAAAWDTASSAYSSNITNNASLSADEKAYAKNLIKYASAQYTDDTDNDYSYCLERAMATYEACIQKHGQDAFMSDVRPVSASSRITPLSIVNGSGNTVAIIVIISMISVTAVGGYFFLRKRKEN